jgi:hypothetical protein
MRVKTVTRRTIVAEVPEIGELQLEFEPESYTEPLVERVGNTVIVGYLTRDNDAGDSPLDEDCANGAIYLAGNHNSLWEDETQVRRELCCQDGRWSGENPDIDRQFTLDDGSLVTLREMAADIILKEVNQDLGLQEDFVKHLGFDLDEDETWQEAFKSLWKEVDQDLLDDNGMMSEQVEKAAFELYAEHWPKLAGPFVVPISYQSYNETIIRPTTWDGDPENLPGGVWVADADAIDNSLMIDQYKVWTGIRTFMRTYPSRVKGEPARKYFADLDVYSLVKDGVILKKGLVGTAAFNEAYMDLIGYAHRDEIHAKTVEYATSVLDEVSKWASGDIWGVVVETHKLISEPGDDPTWERVDVDSVWHHLGQEYAEESLKNEFDSTVERQRSRHET